MRRLLITGGSGFLGRHLAKKLKDDYSVCIASRNEKQLRDVAGSLQVDSYPLDVSNIHSVYECFRRIKPEFVIHAAATKFVDFSERFPNDCIDINVVGSQNIARASIFYETELVIGISTDKVTSPISNIYGFSKAIMERMFLLQSNLSDTNFVCVRYGNVVWSTGSIFPIWDKMTKQNHHVVSTGPSMNRFFFSIENAVELVNLALKNHVRLKGQVLSLPMKAARVDRLLAAWSNRFNISWSTTESRVGDREYEFLIAENELDFTSIIDFDNTTCFVVDNRTFRKDRVLSAPYSSQSAPQLSDEEILSLIENRPEF